MVLEPKLLGSRFASTNPLLLLNLHPESSRRHVGLFPNYIGLPTEMKIRYGAMGWGTECGWINEL